MPTLDKTLRTHYADMAISESTGTGFPLLLLHGSGASRHVFDSQMSGALAANHRVIAIDLPGHGQSSDAFDPATAYTIPGLAAAVGVVLQALGIDRVAVFGWSLGGHVAIEMLASNPAVAGLMLTGTPPIGRGPIGVLRGFHMTFDTMLASKEEFTARDVERFAHMCFGDNPDPSYLRAIERADGRLRKIMFAGMMRGVGADQKRTVERSSRPVAIVNGEHEPIGRLSYINNLSYSTLWDNHCHVIAGSRHAPFLERQDVFDPLLSRFVTDIAKNQASEAGLEVERQVRWA
jgi:pimeloyl-ACP methyl ester carboxylesterase